MQINVYLTNLVVLGSRCNKSGNHWVPNLILYEFMFPWSIKAIFVWPWKMFSVSVRYLFYQLMFFPPKKTLIWRRYCSIGQWCCIVTSMRSFDWFLESSSDMKFFHLSVRLINQKPRCVCIRSTNQSNRSISARRLFLFCLHVFISRSYENSSILKSSV